MSLEPEQEKKEDKSLFNILVVFLSDFQIIIFLILSWCFPSIFQQFNIFILKKQKKTSVF